MLLKANAYPYVRNAGEVRLFKLAWYMHFNRIAQEASSPGDRLFVVVATLGTNKRKQLFEAALDDVCVKQGPQDREIILCHWDCKTTWGLQMADYGLWAIQRSVDKGQDAYLDAIRPLIASLTFPWGSLRAS